MAQSKRRKPKPKPKAPAQELIPHKIVGALIGKRLDEHGEIVAEEQIGEIAIFAASFHKVRQLVDDDMERLREAEKIRREAMSAE